MSSINHHPTFHYSQPEEYRFSHDSVFLARRVFEFLVAHDKNPTAILDVCGGCGIIGLDLLFHLRAAARKHPKVCDFLEVQLDYEKHFIKNVDQLGKIETGCRFVNANYTNLSNSILLEKYDLIVCNPPYFSKQQGKLPASELKLRSRFFVDSDLESLVSFVHAKLSPEGLAFILIRNQLEHKQDQLAEMKSLCRGKFMIHQLEDIRGTHLVQLRPV